jgi:hypothetical protein
MLARTSSIKRDFGAFTRPGMRDDDGLVQLGVQDAINSFDRKEPAVAGGQRGMERAAAVRTDEVSLRLGRAREQSPEDVFDGALHPLGFADADHLARLGIDVHHLTGALQENQNRQSVQNFLLRLGIGIFG